jgi:integrase
MATTQPIRSKTHVKELSAYFERLGQLRNQCYVLISLHTALRVGDILRLTWDDLYDFDRRRVRAYIVVTERKTGKTKQIALHKQLVRALAAYAKRAARPGAFLMENKHTHKVISRQQAYRILRNAAKALGFPFRVSCHSLRKTFGYHAWRNGVSPAVIMEIYNHSSFAVTRRYLGVAQDDQDKVYMRLRFSA